MLVAIAILGILTGVAAASLLGVTELAHRRAQEAELMTVQSAMNAMLMDQSVPPEDGCSLFAAGRTGTADMSSFPSDQRWVRHGGAAPPGHANPPVQLYPQFLHQRTMSRRYRCAGGGTVEPAS